jgi:hypothetical protein
MGTARPRILPLDIASTLGATGRGGRGAALTAMGLAGRAAGRGVRQGCNGCGVQLRTDTLKPGEAS